MRIGSWVSGVLPLLTGLGISLTPHPAALSPHAWHYFALFAAVVVALVLEPIPPASVGVLGVTVAAAAGLVEAAPSEAIRWALSGFSNATVWLIFAAFMFAMGYEKTGLGTRIALLLARKLGERPLGLGYAIALADAALAPFTPSNTARSAGTIYPVIRQIPGLFEVRSTEAARRMGGYLMWTAFATTCVTSSTFVTALAPNLLALGLVRTTIGVDISWIEWARGFWPVSLVLLALVPLLAHRIYHPEPLGGAGVTTWADRELERLGRLTRREVVMGGLAVAALGFWAFGRSAVDATTVALAVIVLMVMTRIVTWDDVLGHRQAWNVLVWFATLVTLADGLNRVGVIAWIAGRAAASLAGQPPIAVMVILVALFFLVHYLFASVTAHVTAVLPVILAAGAAVPGVPPRMFALLLCYSLGLMGVITPYATGPAPVYFASGFLPRKDFWGLGLLFGAIFMVALVAMGLPWLAFASR
jgi:L-tartrate/succinate antiporter